MESKVSQYRNLKMSNLFNNCYVVYLSHSYDLHKHNSPALDKSINVSNWAYFNNKIKKYLIDSLHRLRN